MEYLIIENGEFYKLDELERNYLLGKQMIYNCDECERGIYHVDMHFTIEEIQEELKNLRTN